MRIGTVYPDREANWDPSLQPFFFFVRAEEFHGVPEKNRDFAIQFFVQTIFHFSTSLHRPLILNTNGQL